MDIIYLDHASSTPVKTAVANAFVSNLAVYGNPYSYHKEGIDAQNTIKNSSDIIANKLNCKPEEIHYTSGATMSNNIIFQGFRKQCSYHLSVISNVEHNDIMDLFNHGYIHYQIPVDRDGVLDLEELKYYLNMIRGSNILVSVQMANSETGVIQPIKQISKIVHEKENTYLHVDATQYIPYYPIDVADFGIDALSMSGQKIGGIKGSGLLYIKEKLLGLISPVIYGEQGLIGGTPATPLIASLAEAFKIIDYDITELENKRNFLLAKLEDVGGILIGSRENRLPNNIYIRFPGIKGLTMMNLLNEYGICVGTGSACSTGSDEPSHVALAYGLTPDEAHECVRFTLGNDNTYEDLEYTAQVVKGLTQMLR